MTDTKPDVIIVEVWPRVPRWAWALLALGYVCLGVLVFYNADQLAGCQPGDPLFRSYSSQVACASSYD